MDVRKTTTRSEADEVQGVQFSVQQIRLRVGFIYSLSWASFQRNVGPEPTQPQVIHRPEVCAVRHAYTHRYVTLHKNPEGEGWSCIFRPPMQTGLRGRAVASCPAAKNQVLRTGRRAASRCFSTRINRWLSTTCCLFLTLKLSQHHHNPSKRSR